jgi:hypothetical protein
MAMNFTPEEAKLIPKMVEAMKEVDRVYAPRYSAGPVELPPDHYYWLSAMKIMAAQKVIDEANNPPS